MARLVKISVGVPYSFNNAKTDEERLVEVNKLKNRLIEDGMLDPATDDATWYHHSWPILCDTDYAFQLGYVDKYDIDRSEEHMFIPERIQQAFMNKSAPSASTSVEVAKSDYYNEIVHVHMPGQALALFNRVMLCEDVCTDALQGYLTEGWRILAVCPQPDQRRPDYILGRYEEPDTTGHTSAARG